jgi:hypothetical protein
MDQRVDRPETEIEPAPLSRKPPATRRSRVRGLLVLGVLIVLGLAAGWYWQTHHATQTAGQTAAARTAAPPVTEMTGRPGVGADTVANATPSESTTW